MVKLTWTTVMERALIQTMVDQVRSGSPYVETTEITDSTSTFVYPLLSKMISYTSIWYHGIIRIAISCIGKVIFFFGNWKSVIDYCIRQDSSIMCWSFPCRQNINQMLLLKARSVIMCLYDFDKVCVFRRINVCSVQGTKTILKVWGVFGVIFDSCIRLIVFIWKLYIMWMHFNQCILYMMKTSAHSVAWMLKPFLNRSICCTSPNCFNKHCQFLCNLNVSKGMNNRR